jgi:hypothetical protein
MLCFDGMNQLILFCVALLDVDTGTAMIRIWSTGLSTDVHREVIICHKWQFRRKNPDYSFVWDVRKLLNKPVSSVLKFLVPMD